MTTNQSSKRKTRLDLRQLIRASLKLVCEVLLASAAFPAQTAQAADVTSAATDCAKTTCFYVRPGANGNGSDWDNAFGSLPATLTRGATYFLADGSYGTYTFDDANSSTLTITLKKAVESDHGTGTGWQSAYGDGQAVFSHWQINTDYYVFDGKVRNSDWQRGTFSQYGIKVAGTWPVRLDNAMGTGADNVTFKFIDFQAGGRDTGNGDDVIYGLTGNSNLTFQYCALHDSDRTIFTMRGNWQNLTVDHSYLARNTSTPATHGELMSMTDVTNMTFSHNMIEDIEGTAVWAGINGGVARNLKIYGNVIHHTPAYIADTGRKTGHNFGVSGTIFIANDASNNNSAYGIEFYNNTIYSAQGLWSGVIVQLGSDNKVYNNIWYNSVRTNNSGPDAQGNWYYNTIADGDGSTDKQVCTSGCSIFVNPTANDFHLTAATNAGLALATPFTIDGDGKARGSDGRWDRGAFEFGGTVAIATPTPTPVPTATPIASATPAPTAAPMISGSTLLGSSSPSTIDANDGVSYELGLKFSATTAGQIRAIRFYKSPSESGAHTGKIYSSSGALLASIAFTNESASGWQTAYLTTPLAIAANTTYTVSVNTAGGFYVATVGDLAVSKSSANLIAPVSAGVYGAVGAMPTQTWQSSNYFRDIVFEPLSSSAPAPTATPASTATPSPSSSDRTAPAVAITSPVSGSRVYRSTTTVITATATDNVAVTKVEVYVNGTLKCTDTAAPYTCAWSVPRGRNIPYSIQAKAYDAAGNVGASTSVDVTSR